jgi:ankyrin repeat protein
MNCFSFLIFFTFSSLQPQLRNSPPVFTFIHDKDIGSLSAFLADNNINGRYGIDSITLLSYAILIDQYSVIRYLVEAGADLNLNYMGAPPLSMAVLENQPKTVRLLLRHGASLNAPDSKGNSPLILAASKGNLNITRILVRHGADINYMNPSHNKAYDIAVKSNYPEVSTYLRDQYERNLPYMTDGPFIRWNHNRIRSFYLVHDSSKNVTRQIKKAFPANTDSCLFQGYAGDSCSYRLRKDVDIPACVFSGISRILVMGDIHGGYDSLILFLRNNRVINQQNEWIWDNGHLVFVGDVFDRGDEVTEAFWFIYHMEEQAQKQGGRLHFILGNHEMMIMRNEDSYIADKYYYLTKKSRSVLFVPFQ